MQKKETITLATGFKRGWELFLKQPWFFVWLTVILLAIAALPELIPDVIWERPIGVGLGLVYLFAVVVLSIAVQIGFVRITLAAVRGKELSLRDIVTIRGSVVWHFAFLMFLAGVLTTLGFLFLVIPGVIIGISFMFLQYVVVDNPTLKAGPALQQAWDMSKGVRWKLFGFMLVSVLLSIVGTLLLGVGLLVAIPVIGLTQAVLYESLIKNITLSR